MSGDEGTVRYTVLSHKAIGAWAVLIVVVGVGMAVWLLLAYGHGDPRVQLDAIRTAGTIVVGTGGAAALLLAARRQRSTEIALRQTDRQQVTDLYSKAVEQLGSERAPVRLGGFYALERLAQDNSGQRQTIVNVLCAYLRMPYTNPAGPPSDDADDAVVAVYRERVQEREVRLTAQRLLTTHLRLDIEAARRVDAFWTDIDLDLTGAMLVDFDLSYCQVRTATFTHATFTGYATFEGAKFTGDTTRFERSKFFGAALFAGANFFGDARFADAEFTGRAWFEDANFGGGMFDGAKFADATSFANTEFVGDAAFRGAEFTGRAEFVRAVFTGRARFTNAAFTIDTTFEEAGFADTSTFDGATFAKNTSFRDVRFAHGAPPEVARFLVPSGRRRAARRRAR